MASEHNFFPFKVGEKVICIAGEAGISIAPHADRLTVGIVYIITDVTPNYSKVRTLDGKVIGGRWGNFRFAKVEPEPESEESAEHESVNHPNHYTSVVPGIECIDVVRHFNFCKGNAIKYIWRAGHKNDEVEDLRKAIKNLEFEIERIQNANA